MVSWLQENGFEKYVKNFYGTIANIHNIDVNPKWIQEGITVAGGNGFGNALNQLWDPNGLCIDDNNQVIYTADSDNHRIMEWKFDATSGTVVAGGNKRGNQRNQLSFPRNVIIDQQSDSLIICDWGNKRVVRWSCRCGTNGETIISNIESCGGLAIDNNGSIYISDFNKGEVRRYEIGETYGTVVAGGNGEGNQLNQLNGPTYIFVDQNHAVYVSDKDNHRIMKWDKGATEGALVAGGHGKGDDLTQLKYPYGVFVDRLGTLYVADSWNNRIMRWPKGSTRGEIIVGGNGIGEQANQLNYPISLSFDRQSN
ncbi:unnamed protein product, partial [Rotaria sp. Silwood2]